MVAGGFRAIAFVMALLAASPALAQPIVTAAKVVETMGFSERYESHVDWVIVEMAEQSLFGGEHATTKDITKLQDEVRRYLLAEQAQVHSLLVLGLSQNRSEAELQALQQWLGKGRSIKELPQVQYWIEIEIYNALSGYALVVAMGSDLPGHRQVPAP